MGILYFWPMPRLFLSLTHDNLTLFQNFLIYKLRTVYKDIMHMCVVSLKHNPLQPFLTHPPGLARPLQHKCPLGCWASSRLVMCQEYLVTKKHYHASIAQASSITTWPQRLSFILFFLDLKCVQKRQTSDQWVSSMENNRRQYVTLTITEFSLSSSPLCTASCEEPFWGIHIYRPTSQPFILYTTLSMLCNSGKQKG